jgi:hypothetical protein
MVNNKFSHWLNMVIFEKPKNISWRKIMLSALNAGTAKA